MRAAAFLLSLFVMAASCQAGASRVFVTADADYLERDGAMGVAAYPFAQMVWVKTIATPSDAFVWLGDKDVSDTQYSLESRGAAGAPVPALNNRTNLAGSLIAQGTTDIDTGGIGGWYCLSGTSVSTTLREVFLNGTEEGENTTTIDNLTANIDRYSIGRLGDSTPGNLFEGNLAYAMIWSRDLTNAEMFEACLKPGIFPASLQVFVALWDPSTTTEFDLSGNGRAATVSATPLEDFTTGPQVIVGSEPL